MKNEQVLENHDVKIVNGIIKSIDTKLRKPRHAEVVDASGLFLMPALFDMHAHVSYQNPWQPCFRASPLTKTYGFGIHCDSSGKVALCGMETEEYQGFLSDSRIKKLKAMKSSK